MGIPKGTVSSTHDAIHTHCAGTGFCQVWVQVKVQIPQGVPMQNPIQWWWKSVTISAKSSWCFSSTLHQVVTPHHLFLMTIQSLHLPRWFIPWLKLTSPTVICPPCIWKCANQTPSMTLTLRNSMPSQCSVSWISRTAPKLFRLTSPKSFLQSYLKGITQEWFKPDLFN